MSLVKLASYLNDLAAPYAEEDLMHECAMKAWAIMAELEVAIYGVFDAEDLVRIYREQVWEEYGEEFYDSFDRLVPLHPPGSAHWEFAVHWSRLVSRIVGDLPGQWEYVPIYNALPTF
jgi:hypothetical protein